MRTKRREAEGQREAEGRVVEVKGGEEGGDGAETRGT
jgi:hypothetical protein